MGINLKWQKQTTVKQTTVEIDGYPVCSFHSTTNSSLAEGGGGGSNRRDPKSKKVYFVPNLIFYSAAFSVWISRAEQ